jgi:hypothetical protein
MGKLREGTATERNKEMNKYRRYNVDCNKLSEKYKEKDRMQG